MKKKDCNVLLQSMSERLADFRSTYKICRREFSEEAVHDLRVAARRLLATLDLGRALSPRPSLQKTRRALKEFLDGLDDLRDVQVLLVDAGDLLEMFPQLKAMLKRLKKQEKELLGQAVDELKKSHLVELTERVGKIQTQLEQEICGTEFNANLLKAVDDAYGRARQAHGQVDERQGGTIHRLRIAFKKFRYMVEIALPLLKNYPETHLERMHTYQSLMGDVQDAEVFLQMLDDHAGHASASDLEAVCQSLETRRAESISTYLNSKDDLFSFWRPTSDEAFPWEGPNETLHRPSRNRRRSGVSRSRVRQPEAADRQGPQEDASNSAGLEGAGGES
jgi:CHAD domain-containing protein